VCSQTEDFKAFIVRGVILISAKKLRHRDRKFPTLQESQKLAHARWGMMIFLYKLYLIHAANM